MLSKPFIAALILHGVMLVSLWHPLQHSTARAGIVSASVVTAYFSEVMPSSARVTPSAGHAQSRTTQATEKYHDTQGNDALLSRLHNLIQSQQRYPEVAALDGDAGAATVRFQLMPDGEVDAIQLIQSSGETTLDNAAIEAVKAIAPVAHTMLTKPTLFTVKIDFS